MKFAEKIKQAFESTLDRKNYVFVKDKGFYVGKTILTDHDGEPILSDWFDFKLAVQELAKKYEGLKPAIVSSAEWEYGRLCAQKLDEENGRDFDSPSYIEKDFLRSIPEFTDSLVAFADGEYPSLVSKLLRSRVGRRPIGGRLADWLRHKPVEGRVFLIEHPQVVKKGEEHEVIDGTVKEVTENPHGKFPRNKGYVLDYDWETGLVNLAGPGSPANYSLKSYYRVYPKGAQVVMRKAWSIPSGINYRNSVFLSAEPGYGTKGAAIRLSLKKFPYSKK